MEVVLSSRFCGNQISLFRGGFVQFGIGAKRSVQIVPTLLRGTIFWFDPFNCISDPIDKR